ncbi:hypothetical protein B0H15DRAFT_158785 [Mycena belliarum]|uniref:Uncharacterized protein n=1 Tax=Mycena belliarum TaxID=1033014 RepID=A0AAD6XT55_9AGAR|nr:hypothetical protein B0H15DRAFT_517791 [Mycena belliae]KAJ7093447.1 hypothetical protein B0H15DRAFT_158785 [Mycena belliae]
MSSYIKRQSQTRGRKGSVSLTAIEEEEAALTQKKTSSVKLKRRLGVSDLRIPRATPVSTGLPGDALDWHLTLDDSPETFRFPRPPPFDAESSGSSGSSSSSSGSSDSGSVSSAATTPAASPVAETHPCVARCQSIKPLTIKKRVASPAPSSDSHDDAWEDDDEYYAAQARAFITLSPPLPPSFPLAAPTARNRESTIIPSPAPHRASVRLSRAITIPTRPPPPPPIVTSSPSSSCCSTRSARPPPRTPVPTDAQSGDYGAYGALLSALSSPLLSALPPAPFASSPSSSASSSPRTRLAALLSPTPHGTPEVPSDVADSADEWEEEWDTAYDDVPLSPLVAPAPCASSPPPSPIAALEVPAYFPPTPVALARAQKALPPTPAPALRSRWSTSTLASVHSAHARAPASPRAPAFAFARRYFPQGPAKTAVLGTASLGKKAKATGRGKGRRLTPADVRVVGLGRDATPTPPTPASAQYASYPAPPTPALYAAYTTQRSPKRRASLAHSSGASSSGHSEAGSDCSEGAGIKRKPIPVGLFLR